jgi:hypothetical protein
MADATCDLGRPAALRGGAEILTEALEKMRQAVADHCRAVARVVEEGARVAAAGSPEEFGARLVGFWARGLDCLRPWAELQGQAARFAVSWGLHLAGGMKTVSKKTYHRRLEVCRACDFFRDNHCLSCGCRLGGAVVAKARWAEEKCPLGKW